MYKTTLIRLCKLLSRKEMTRFKQFAASPYFNKHSDVLCLIETLCDVYPNWEDERLEREQLFRTIFGDRNFDIKKLKYVFSYSVNLYEDFISVECLRKDEFKSKEYLLETFLYKNENKRFDSAHKSLFEKEPNYKHYNQYILNNLADLFYVTKPKLRINNYLQQKHDHFDQYFIAEKFKIACVMLIRERMMKVKFNYFLLDEIVEYVSDNLIQFQKSPHVLIYYHAYLLLVCPELENNYYQLVFLLNEKGNVFTKTEIKTLYIFAYNFCANKINKGENKFTRELFNLFNNLLHYEVLSDNNGFLAWALYKNIATIALRLKEYDWAIKFIENYKDKLYEKVREGAYSYSLSSYYFETKQYDKVLTLLINFNINDLIYSLDAKVLQIKLFFVKQEWEALEHALVALQQLLRRNKSLSNERKQRFLDFVKYLNLVVKVKQNVLFTSRKKIKNSVEELKNIVNNEPNFTAKDWLLEKINEI